MWFEIIKKVLFVYILYFHIKNIRNMPCFYIVNSNFYFHFTLCISFFVRVEIKEKGIKTFLQCDIFFVTLTIGYYKLSRNHMT